MTKGTGLSCGFVGLPNVGKSTLFNAVTKQNAAQAENYPFCTIEPNVGIVEVPDHRLSILSKLSSSAKIIPAVITFVDIAGLVKGASDGEGLGNKFLTNIRETDVIIHVVRCFDSDDIIHVHGKVDPIHDAEIINLELILADLQLSTSVKSKVEKSVRGNKEMQPVLDILVRVEAHLSNSLPISSLEMTEDERKLITHYNFITCKKTIYLANVDEDSLPSFDNPYIKALTEYAKNTGSIVVPVCAKLEEELAALDPDEAALFLEDVGLSQSSLEKLIKSSYDELNLITYITTGEIETRAWTIHKGTLAPEAAGKIHTDLEKGFIRAEVIKFEDFEHFQTRTKAKEAGKMSVEGKQYAVEDGDVILFLTNN